MSGWLVYLQRSASGSGAVNAGLRDSVADLLYETIAILAGWAARRVWKAHLAHLSDQVLAVVRCDPGCRVLVVVNVRHCHHLRHGLRQHPKVQVIDYARL